MIRLLFIDDDRRAHDTLELVLPPEFELISATTLAHGARLAAAGEVDLVLLDVNFPEGSGLDLLPRITAQPAPPPVVMLTAVDDVRQVVAAVQAGASDYLVKPYELPTLLATLHAALANGAARRAAGAQPRSDDGLVGESPGLRQVRELIRLYADSDAPVMVTGESGTGKELVAHAVHRLSHRTAAPFVAINCGAIPDTLVESELFGAEAGAFTGAVARAGCFERAEGGTLLLDEVAEMPLPAQVTLLRVLETREVTRVGGRQPIPLNVRVVSATNRDPEGQVAAGTLRLDLWYRLAVLAIQVPPLRDRSPDIPLLADALLRERAPGSAGAAAGVRLSGAAAERLRAHPWPGNVRELRNVLERARLLARRRAAGGGAVVIEPSDIALGPPKPASAHGAGPAGAAGF